MSVLRKILAHKRAELEQRAARVPLAQIRRRALAAAPPLARFCKSAARTRTLRHSRNQTRLPLGRPDRGPGPDRGCGQLSVRRRGGAFGAGPMRSSSPVATRIWLGPRAACQLPVLRKDFVVDPWQVHEARALGADAVLVIMAAVDDPAPLLEVAGELGMDALVEIHDQSELDRALSCGASLIGVNNRNLQTFHTDLAVTERLAPQIGGRALLVAESGVKGRIRSGAAGRGPAPTRSWWVKPWPATAATWTGCGL